MKFCCAILFCMDLITATRACTVILQYVVGSNLSWRKEGELVPACKSVCGNMHAQTKPVSMLLPVSVAIGKCETIFNHIQAYRWARRGPSFHRTLPDLRGISGGEGSNALAPRVIVTTAKKFRRGVLAGQDIWILSAGYLLSSCTLKTTLEAPIRSSDIALVQWML